MKLLSKAEANRQLTEIRHERDCLFLAMSSTQAGDVTWTFKGSQKLGICRECAPCGGIVLVCQRDNADRKWAFIGAYYWEAWHASIRSLPIRHDDKEAQDLRTCAEQVASQISSKQSAFYAPKVAAAVLSA